MLDNDDTIAPNGATPSSGTSNSAAVLFELSARAGKLFRRSTADALACGRLLLQARQIADHGAWLPFLRDAEIPARSSQRLMRVAEYVGDDQDRGDILSHLGVTRTLEFLRARDRATATWLAACKADQDNREVIQRPPESALSGIAWCDDPADREIVAEVAAHAFGIDVAELLAAIEPA